MPVMFRVSDCNGNPFSLAGFGNLSQAGKKIIAKSTVLPIVCWAGQLPRHALTGLMLWLDKVEIPDIHFVEGAGA